MPTTINERAAPKLGPLGGGKTPSSTCDLRWSGAAGRVPGRRVGAGGVDPARRRVGAEIRHADDRKRRMLRSSHCHSP